MVCMCVAVKNDEAYEKRQYVNVEECYVYFTARKLSQFKIFTLLFYFIRNWIAPTKTQWLWNETMGK